MSTLQGSWSLSSDKKTLSYTVGDNVVAKITGLDSSKVTIDAEDGTIAGIEMVDQTEEAAGTIKLSQAVLGTAQVSLALQNGGNYALALAEDTDGDGKIGFEESDPSWSISGTTATYKYEIAKGYTLTDTKTITCTPSVSTTIAKVAGLKSGLKAEDLNGKDAVAEVKDEEGNVITAAQAAIEPGIKVTQLGGKTAGTIALSIKVLGTDPKTKVTLTPSKDYSYALTTDASVPTSKTNANVFTVDKGTATYKTVETAYYTLTDNKTLAYTAQTKGTNIATIKNLNTKATASDLSANDAMNVITVKDSALINKTVTITKAKDATVTYKLALAADTEKKPSVASNVTFAPVKNKTQVTIKANLTEGYEASEDGSKIVYTAPKTGTSYASLVTISGVQKNLTADQYKAGISVATDESGNVVKDTNGNVVVTLSGSVLNGTNVTAGTAGYTLALNRDTVVDDTDLAVKDGIDVWRVNKNTASYKKVKLAHYEEQDGKIIYVPEQDVTVYATLTGLKSKLTVSEDGQSLLDGTNTAATINTTNKKITLYSNALTSSSVSFSDNAADYHLLLDDNVTKPTQNALALTVSKGTATLKTGISAGWTLTSDMKAVAYSAAQSKATLATVTGLSSKNASSSNVEYDATSKTITLSKDSLGTANAAITSSYGYTLALKSDVPQGVKTINRWSVSTTTATYDEYTKEHYTLDSRGTSVSYSAETKSGTLATLTGIRGGLKPSTEDSDGNIDTLINGDNKTIITADDKESTITLTEGALNKQAIKLTTNEGYVLELDETLDPDDIKPKEEYTLDYDDKGSIVKLYYGKTAGYKRTNDTTVVYYDADQGANQTTVSGIKSGMTIGKDENGNPALGTGTYLEDENGEVSSDSTFEAWLTFDTGDKKVKILSKDALTSSSVTFANNASNYQFDINDEIEDGLKSESGLGWSVNGNTARLQNYTSEGWAETKKSGKVTSITYTPEKYGTLHATVTGIKSSSQVNAGKVTGLEATDDGEGNVTITVSKALLDGKDIEVTKATGDTNNYMLAFGDDVDKPGAVTKQWVYDKANNAANYKEIIPKGYALSLDGQTITYAKAAKSNVLATVKGVKNVDDFDDNFDEETGVLTIPRSALNKSDVTFTKNPDNFKLELEDGDDELTTDINGWTAVDKNGVAKLEGTISGGYAAAADGSKITYKAETDGTLATLKGLKPKLSSDYLNGSDDDPDTVIPAGIQVDNTTGKIILQNTDILANGNVTLTSTNYTLDVKSTNEFGVKTLDPELRFSSGTATVVQGVSKGWTLNGTKALAFTKENVQTLAKITDLNPKAVLGTDLSLNTSNNTITLNNAALNAKKVSLTNNTNMIYYLALGSDVTLLSKDFSEPRWSVDKTTATLKTGKTKGYERSADSQTITYLKNDTATTIVATLKGVKSGLKPDSNGKIEGINVYENNTISVYGNALGKSNITLTSEDYKLVDTGLTEPHDEDPIWNGSKGTATLTQSNSEGWTLSADQKTLAYTAEKTNATLATIKGLDATFDADKNGDSGLVYDKANKTITVMDEALGTSKVTLTGKGLSLAIGADAKTSPKVVTSPEWVTSKTTATYKTYTTAYYTMDKNGAIVYHKPVDNMVYAEVKGIKNGVNISDCVLGNVITLGESQLGTSKVTLTNKNGADFMLALDNSAPTVSQTNKKWYEADKKGVATLKGTLSAGYTLAEDGKSISYSKEKTNQPLATVSGIKSGTKLDTPTRAGVITLKADQIDSTKDKVVTLTVKNGTYKLELANGMKASQIETVKAWTTATKGKVTTATLKGEISEGYVLTSDTTVAVTAANTDKTLATVSGLATGASLNAVSASDKSITLTNEQLNNKVTVGGGAFEFNFAGDYNNAAVVGSAAADSIAVNGSGLTVTGGKGSDHIDLGSAGSNTLIYAKGDGNDVIADFTAGTDSDSDKLKITGVTLTQSNFTTDGFDVLVSVGNNVITLEGVAGKTITVLDKNNTASYFNTSSADLLEDDNFLTGGAQLDEITNTSFDANSLDDVDTTAQSLKTLTKQSTLVAYGSDKK